MPTTPSSTTASPAGCSPPEQRSCAIHQPNYFPRLATLAKLFSAACWIVLDDVQFTRRDYQHRARLPQLHRPDLTQWLSLSVHLPHGRDTLIRDVTISDPDLCRRRTQQMLGERYRRAAHWADYEPILHQVLDLFHTTDSLATIAEATTSGMLTALGWTGTTLHSSDFRTRADRQDRRIDLALAANATTYLYGRGGSKYADVPAFARVGITARQHTTPTDDIWATKHAISGMHALMTSGAPAITAALRRHEERIERQDAATRQPAHGVFTPQRSGRQYGASC